MKARTFFIAIRNWRWTTYQGSAILGGGFSHRPTRSDAAQASTKSQPNII
jgi:hypothetical protein